MKAIQGLTCLCLCAAISGCGILRPSGGEGVSAVDLPYRSAIKRGEDRRDVTVTVRAEGASLDDVRESVRFPVTRYCLSTYGGSEADWTIDPATDDWAFSREGRDMVFTARCTAR